ncbi:MAG: hypothetical protein M3R04_06990 [bacterium]|nr:hypothetical protein [bacterium]
MVTRTEWDNVVIVHREGTTDTLWDGKIKNTIWDAASMSWVAQTAATSGALAGDASAANQATEITKLTSIDGKLGSLGQKAMAGSAPVVIASDQGAVPVTGPLTDAQLRANPAPTDLRRGLTILFASVSAASSGANQIVAADATKRIKVLQYSFVADAAVTAKWQSAATDLTGSMSFDAKGGIASPCGTPAGGWLLQTEVNEALNLNLGGAVGVRGHITYFLEA